MNKRTITINHDGDGFTVMYTDCHVIQHVYQISDIDLKIPDDMKEYLKTIEKKPGGKDVAS